jgi:hypothetical protein
MVMPPWDTFDYIATVPQPHDDSSLDCAARLVQPVTRKGHEVTDRRLVGYAPRLQIIDAGPSDSAYLRVLRSRVTLTASNRQDATVSSISFYVDRDLIAQLQPGDDLHMSRTACGGLGLSILRQGELVVAVGAVTAVNLGNDFEAFSAYELAAKASRIFQKVDSGFCFAEMPVEFVHKKQHRILFSGMCHLGDYVVLLRHGFMGGVPGTDASAAICRSQDQVPVYASASATLLEDCSPEIREWRDG